MVHWQQTDSVPIGHEYNLFRILHYLKLWVPAIIQVLYLYLFQAYGKITAKQFKKKYNEVAAITYYLTKLITIIFDAINDNHKLRELAGKPHNP